TSSSCCAVGGFTSIHADNSADGSNSHRVRRRRLWRIVLTLEVELIVLGFVPAVWNLWRQHVVVAIGQKEWAGDRPRWIHLPRGSSILPDQTPEVPQSPTTDKERIRPFSEQEIDTARLGSRVGRIGEWRPVIGTVQPPDRIDVVQEGF